MQNPMEENKDAEKAKVVVIMGATGAGKSKLAIDLATHFPIEVINADSMQVYHGLDVLTNKVPLHEQKGVPHHLLGTVSPNVEFTAKDFRDSAIILIDEILSRNCLPVIVGGTNYYIQALVSPFLLDETGEDLDASGDEQAECTSEFRNENLETSYDYLKQLDPVAANRVHPNNQRKIKQFLSLYARSGILPSKIYQGKASEKWGRIDNCRYNCCFICVDAATSAIDQYVNQRVDCMLDAGLLCEVYDIYNLNADYTRGLRQAIGVREFEEFLGVYLSENENNKAAGSADGSSFMISTKTDKMLKDEMKEILRHSDDNPLKPLLTEAIDKVKLNTRRLVRRQTRRVKRLQELFGWNIYHVDATEYISGRLDELWAVQVVRPSVQIIRSFLSKDGNIGPELKPHSGSELIDRKLWTQYICKACGDRVLRGAHEWEQHIQGRGHQKRSSKFRKSQAQEGFSVQKQKQHSASSEPTELGDDRIFQLSDIYPGSEKVFSYETE